jgi:hypothetical protein
MSACEPREIGESFPGIPGLDAGHGGASGRHDHLREIAFDYAFILTQLGLAAPNSPPPAS